MWTGCAWSHSRWSGCLSCTEWRRRRRPNTKPSATSAKSAPSSASGKRRPKRSRFVTRIQGRPSVTWNKPHKRWNVAAVCLVHSCWSLKGRAALEGRHLSKCQQLIRHWLNTIWGVRTKPRRPARTHARQRSQKSRLDGKTKP